MIARSRLEALDVPDAHKIDKLPCLFLLRDFDFDFILLSFVSYLGPDLDLDVITCLSSPCSRSRARSSTILVVSHSPTRSSIRLSPMFNRSHSSAHPSHLR